MEESFTETVVNYRKNGETYLCQIKVVPLYNEVNELTHYLAFEKELAAYLDSRLPAHPSCPRGAPLGRRTTETTTGDEPARGRT